MNLHLPSLFDLRSDQKDAADIARDVEAGARLGGTNLWVLLLAILIASVGLNVNSTAVIIGAMLISPLMGPIVGLGYGAAVFDLALIRIALRNLAIFLGLSLSASTLYFLISPLDATGSELLARTSPSLWDVLIAALGGAAGMVAMTRRGYTNVVPGVAIATALMPPICTVGFSLAHARWGMAAGALYLFVINAVFIAAASLFVAGLLRLPTREVVDPQVRARHRRWIVLALVIVMAPSLVLGWRMVRHEVIAHGAEQVARQLLREPQARVLAYELDVPGRVLRLELLGRSGVAAETVLARLQARGIHELRVELVRIGEDLAEQGAARLQQRDAMVRGLVEQIHTLEARIQALEDARSAAPTSSDRTR